MENKSGLYTNISLPSIIVEKIENHIKNTEFKTVSEYLVFVLKEILDDQDSGSALTKEEEGQVKKRLKDLGYL